VIALVVSGAGGAETVREGFVAPAVARGWTVALSLTPTAGRWLRELGELPALEALTGLPVRTTARLPGDPRPHPRPHCLLVAPASANTVAKLAIGIGDNQALTVAVEAVGTRGLPVVVFPRINAAHARHPAWAGHVAALTAAGVRIVGGDDVWPLLEPGDAADARLLPWAHLVDVVAAALATR
jgi:hypothetical protein